MDTAIACSHMAALKCWRRHTFQGLIEAMNAVGNTMGFAGPVVISNAADVAASTTAPQVVSITLPGQELGSWCVPMFCRMVDSDPVADD